MEALTRLNDEFSKYTSKDNGQFQTLCRKLFRETFVVRDKSDESRRDFWFISRHRDDFNDYLSVMNYTVLCDEQIGVAKLENLSSSEDGLQTNRRLFNLMESMVLSAIWILYDDAMVSGKLAKSVFIDRGAIDDQLEKAMLANRLNMKNMGSVLKRLESCNLIEVIGNIDEPGCKIKLFPSLQFCLDEATFRELAKTTDERMRERSRCGAKKKNTLEEETDTSEDTDDMETDEEGYDGYDD